MPLTDWRVRDLLTAFAAGEPTPGGGSASALASAVGAALLLMVAQLPRTRADSEEDRTALALAAGALTGLQRQLGDAIDADTDAYDAVTAAYRLPRGTDAERQARAAAVQEALALATEVPLGVMRASAQALSLARSVATHGNRRAASDVGVAVRLLQAGMEGARLNVGVNVESLTDGARAGAARAESQRIAREAEANAADVEALLRLG